MGKLRLNTPTADYYFWASDKMIRTIEFASRLCYDAGDKATVDTWKNYIGARVKSGHESITEHGMLNLIIDFTKAQRTESQLRKEYFIIRELERLFAGIRIRTGYDSSFFTMRTKLHYCCESGWNSVNAESNIVSISGNVKMWRDFIKAYISTGNYHMKSGCEVVDIMVEIFKYYDYVACGGIFTSDIPELHSNPDLVRSGKLLVTDNENLGLTASFRTPDEIPLINLNHCDIIYKQRDVEITNENYENNAELDFGTTTRLLSLDNPPRDLLSFGSFNPEQYIMNFVHSHILDLGSVSYWIKMPRIVSQQEARHRENSISQRSQRYVNEAKKIGGFYVPDSIKKLEVRQFNQKTNEDLSMEEVYLKKMNEMLSFYDELVGMGVPKDDARNVLPGGIYTQMVVTKPFYTLPHYFKERCSDRAQMEIREPAKALREYLNSVFTYVKYGCPMF